MEERDEWVALIEEQIEKSLQSQLSQKQQKSDRAHGDKAEVGLHLKRPIKLRLSLWSSLGIILRTLLRLSLSLSTFRTLGLWSSLKTMGILNLLLPTLLISPFLGSSSPRPPGQRQMRRLHLNPPRLGVRQPRDVDLHRMLGNFLA